jgi:hypothetical protein
VQRHPARVDGLQEGDECVPQPLVVRPAVVGRLVRNCPVAARRPAWRGERLQVGHQPIGGGIAEPDLQIGGAVAASATGEEGRLLRVLVFLLQSLALVLLGDLGCYEVEDSTAQDPQAARAELGGLLDQPLLGLYQDLGGDVVRQGLECTDDLVRLLEVHGPVPQRGGHARPAAVEGRGEPGVTAGLAAVQPSSVGQPRGGITSGSLLADILSGCEHSQAQLSQLPRDPAELQQRVALLPRGHEHRLDTRNVLERRSHLRRAPQQRMSAGGAGVMIHDSSADSDEQLFVRGYAGSTQSRTQRAHRGELPQRRRRDC